MTQLLFCLEIYFTFQFWFSKETFNATSTATIIKQYHLVRIYKLMLSMLGTNLKPGLFKSWQTVLKRAGQFQCGSDSFKTGPTAVKQAQRFCNLLKL